MESEEDRKLIDRSVIKLECDGPPRACDWAKDRLWTGDPRRMTAWAKARGDSVRADGR